MLLAHDLKNPLAAILANLHFLLGSASDPEDAEAIQDSVALCSVLDRMISNLDLMARGPTIAPYRQPVGLVALAEQLVKRMALQASSTGVQLVLTPAENVDPIVEADPSLLTRALENLVSNSLENGPSGSTIEVIVVERDGRALVLVRDDGPIIPEDLRAIAFDLDEQMRFKKNPTGRYGRGCGLAAAALAAELAGASIEIDADGARSELRLVAPLGASSMR